MTFNSFGSPGSKKVVLTTPTYHRVLLGRERFGRICSWTVAIGAVFWYGAFALFLANLTPFASYRDLAALAIRYHILGWIFAIAIVGLLLARILYGFRYFQSDTRLPEAYVFLSGSNQDLWRVPLMIVFVAIDIPFLFVVPALPLLVGTLFLYSFPGK